MAELERGKLRRSVIIHSKGANHVQDNALIAPLELAPPAEELEFCLILHELWWQARLRRRRRALHGFRPKKLPDSSP